MHSLWKKGPSNAYSRSLSAAARLKWSCAEVQFVTRKESPHYAPMSEKKKSFEMGGVRLPLFDSHFHIIDPRFPLVPNGGYVPKAFTTANYLEEAVPLGIVGGAIVSGSFQAFDQRCLLAALRALGPNYVGVTQLSSSITDEEILRLGAASVRAARFSLQRGGSATLDELAELAARAYDLAGWHAEVYVDGRDLPDIFSTLAALPKVVIDHLGLTKRGLPHLLRLVESGACVKATGFGRLDFDPASAMNDIAGANPEALSSEQTSPRRGRRDRSAKRTSR